MRRILATLAALIAATAAVAPSGQAQAALPTTPAAYVGSDAPASTSAARLRPALQGAALFSRVEAAPDAERVLPAPALARERQVRNRRGVPLMVAGGILFVAGAIAGDDVGTIFMLGGAGVGAWGAYVYFGGG